MVWLSFGGCFARSLLYLCAQRPYTLSVNESRNASPYRQRRCRRLDEFLDSAERGPARDSLPEFLRLCAAERDSRYIPAVRRMVSGLAPYDGLVIQAHH